MSPNSKPRSERLSNRRTRNSEEQMANEEYPPSPEEENGRTEGRRRADPVVRQEAVKRGLDVTKLNASQTPAWRNLRTRNGGQNVQYYDDMEQDDHVEEPRQTRRHGNRRQEEEHEEVVEEHSQSEEEEEEDDPDNDGGSGGHRKSRRARNVVDRYKPEAPRGKARGSYRSHDLHDEDEDDSDGAPHKEHSSHYPTRDRKTVDRFNPAKYTQPGGGSGGSGRGRGTRRGSSFGQGRPRHHDDDEDDEEDEDTQRRQYSFRDRSQCTIKPASQQQGPSQNQGSGDRYGDRKRPRLERYMSSRLRRSGPSGDVLDVLPGTMAPTGGLVQPQYQQPQGLFATPGRQPQPQKPWELALAAAGLPQPTAAAAGGGGGVPAHHGGAAAVGGSSSLEITPVEVDPTLTFESVGGLAPYVRALKEMVFLPLTYPELFERFGISPPRGVLFYGPPGTGKTLVARALAAHASRATPGKKVSFYMRKGADVLSKWVGEAERHLRLLFEEARKNQPSIIFFDEIDGLAPVRSSKADQIHNSIVSTLLALMDGLDSRGHVVVIGATNRVDALDGALRRPGRFDRELAFPLPGQQARREILGIHTRKWSENPGADLLEELSASTVGYCGADLRALCTEASLAALRRRYPQIYSAEQKLLIDLAEVKVEKKDFLTALTAITPASHRSTAAHARPLPPVVAPVLSHHLGNLLATLEKSFPPAVACLAGEMGPGASSTRTITFSSVMRPRLLVCGADGCGQGHLGPALLHALEGLHTQAVGLPSLLSDAGARSPEEALVHAVAEARRAAPAILYLPHLQLWWDTAPSSLRATLWALLADLPSDLPLLLLATADVPVEDLDPAAVALFGGAARGDSVYELTPPTGPQRSEFFGEVAREVAVPAAPEEVDAQGADDPAATQQLPLAPDAIAAEEDARKQAEHAVARKKYEEDQAVLRALRMLLRDVITRLLTTRKWEPYWEPVDPEEDPQYYDKVARPMDLCTLLCRIDGRKYHTVNAFLADLALIPGAEREYWGEAPGGARFISRACALEDAARASLETALTPELVARLEQMAAAGGPAPPPPGLPEPAAPAVDDAADEYEGHAHGGASGHSRRATRHKGGAGEKVIYGDPEAERRRIVRLKKEMQQKQIQQQEQEAGDDASPVPGSDELMEDQPTDVDATMEADEEQEKGAPSPRPVLATSTKDNLPASHDQHSTEANKEVACGDAAARLEGGPSAVYVVSEGDLVRAKTLQQELGRCTDGLVLEQMEGLMCLLQGVVKDNKKETDREKVVEQAVQSARQFVSAVGSKA